MRGSMVALVALTFSGILACSKLEPPTGPTASMLTSPNAATLARVDPLDISGSWVTSEFIYATTLAGTDTDIWLRCESYAYPENEQWNHLLLEQVGSKIVGTSRSGMGIHCMAGPAGGDEGIGWFIDIDDAFEGRATGNQVRLSLNRYIEARVTPDPNGGWSGTIRVRIDPRPYAEPYWVEQRFDLSTTTIFPCWWVHLEPPYCIDFP